jgi:hypothetical protein
LLRDSFVTEPASVGDGGILGDFVGWAKGLLRRAHHREGSGGRWARLRFAHPTICRNFSFSRRNLPEFCIVRYPRESRGRREDRVAAAPGARRDALASSPTWRLHGRARTTRLHRPQRVPHVSGIFASTAFRLAFRDDRDTPLMPRRDADQHAGNQNFGRVKYF